MNTDIATFLEARHCPSAAQGAAPTPIIGMPRNAILLGDCLDILPRLPAASVDLS